MSVDNMITVEHLTQTISITKIGVFIWNLVTDHVIYSKEWAEIVGYDQHELKPHVCTWESMLFPDDLKIAENNINRYLAGEEPIYEAEFRMTRKDGSVIWGHDKGKVTKYTQDGKPLILCGVLQDITNIKLTEQMLRESTDILNLAIEVAEFGTWDWDLINDVISYNDEYLSMLGYTQNEINGSLAEWEDMNHPEDVIMVTKLLDDFVAGISDRYECETRMRHKDGHYIWTKDVGRIVTKDENGIATRVIGGHLNIDSLKNSQFKLQETLDELENYQSHLEYEIETRTKALIEQDKLLMAVNNVSQKLLAINETESFDNVLIECLKNLTKAFNTSEFTLWRFIKVGESEFFYLTHLYREIEDAKIIFDVSNIHDYIQKLLLEGNDFQIHTKEDGNVIINYSKTPMALREAFETEKSIRDLMSDLNEEWQDDVQNQIENSDTSIATAIYLYNDLFGIIATGSNSGSINYSEAHESMLNISGKLFANAQKKHEMDEQLRNAHEEALLSSQAKSNFLANMSHEIRTPLNAILGMSEIVLRESRGRASEEYAVEIKNASESLLIIINDILDISKIESGKLEIFNVEYNITSLLNDIISMSKMRLEDKPVILTAFIQSDIPCNLCGDEIRIKQILVNLISNAIKFTKKGSICFEVSGEMQDETANLVFKVKDTGMGIKQDDMNRLFMQFERVDTKKNRNIEGTGLGLAITKQLCEMMGGTISVESKVGEGSVFTVRIPQKFSDFTPVALKANNNKVLLYEAREVYANSIKHTISDLNASCTVCVNQSELTQYLTQQKFDYLLTPVLHVDKIKKLCMEMDINVNIVLMADPGDLTIYLEENVVNLPITCIQMAQIFNGINLNKTKKEKNISFVAPSANVLVVDDNTVNLKVAKGLMAPYKFNLETAINGMIAVEKVKNNRYDLVFMDHMMPEMDGIDATAAIRKMQGDYYRDLPIIALTANALVGAKELFVKEGMNDFLAKPIETKKLNDILKKWIPEQKQEVSTPKEEIENEFSLSIDGINTNYGINMMNGKLDDYYDVLNAFYHDGLKKIDTLKAANTQKKYDTFRIEIHALKSAAGSIGAFNVSQEAKMLEKAAIKQDYNYISAHTEDFLAGFSKVLCSISEHLKNREEENLKGKESGNIALLKENLNEIDLALTTFDIDVLDRAMQECLIFAWKGEINNLLLKLKQLIDAFEYYNARPIVQELKEEISAQYDV